MVLRVLLFYFASNQSGLAANEAAVTKSRYRFKLDPSFSNLCLPNDILWSIKHLRSKLEYTQKSLRTYLVILAWDFIIYFFTCLRGTRAAGIFT